MCRAHKPIFYSQWHIEKSLRWLTATRLYIVLSVHKVVLWTVKAVFAKLWVRCNIFWKENSGIWVEYDKMKISATTMV